MFTASSNIRTLGQPIALRDSVKTKKNVWFRQDLGIRFRQAVEQVALGSCGC